MGRKRRRDLEEFTQMVTGTHPDEKSYREYVLSELRCAHTRAKLFVNEIETIGIALASNLIDVDAAMEMMNEANVLYFVKTIDTEIDVVPTHDKIPEETAMEAGCD